MENNKHRKTNHMKILVFLLLLSLLSTLGKAQIQTEQTKIKPFMATGYGFYKHNLILNSTSLLSEIGIKLPNGYVLMAQLQSTSADNTIGTWVPMAEMGLDFDLIYTQKYIWLLTGYEIVSNNQRHTLMPIVGPFYCIKKIATPNFDNQFFYGTKIEKEHLLGFAPGLRYSYNFKNSISVGVNSTFYFAMHYGLFSYSITPIVAFRLK